MTVNILLLFNSTDIWQELIDDCLTHIEPEIQSAAVAAIPAFFTEYYKKPDGSAKTDIQGTYMFVSYHNIILRQFQRDMSVSLI